MTLEQLLDAARSRVRRYTPEEAHAATAHGAAIVDIRDRRSRERDGTVPGGIHVPRTVLEWRVASDEWRNTALDGRRLILICDHGYSSLLAAAQLLELGHQAGDVLGGFEAWVASGLPAGQPPVYEGLPGMGPPD